MLLCPQTTRRNGRLWKCYFILNFFISLQGLRIYIVWFLARLNLIITIMFLHLETVQHKQVNEKSINY